MIIEPHIPLITRSFESLVEQLCAPGVTFAISHEGSLLHSRAIGRCAVEPERPVSISTPFRIASMTKSFACAALLILRDEGKLSLEQAAQSVLPSLALSEPLGRASIHDLLSMAIDLPTDDPWADRQLGATDAEFSTLIATRALHAQDGSRRCCYSNLSYFLVGRLISTLSGQNALTYITERLLQPLSLRNTFWNPYEAQRDEVAVGYCLRDGQWVAEPDVDCRGDGAVFGGLWSTLEDVTRWLDFLSARPGSPAAYEGVLRASSRREMQGCYSWIPPQPFTRLADNTPCTEFSTYGYGLRHSVVDGLHTIGHSGGLPGFGSHMRVNLETGLSVIALANGTYAPVWNACREALDLLAQCNFYPGQHLPTECAEVASLLTALINAWSDELADSLFTPSFWQDYPRESFVRDCGEQRRRLGNCVILNAVEPLPGGRALLVLTGSAASLHVTFGIAPLGPPLKVQSLTWQE